MLLPFAHDSGAMVALPIKLLLPYHIVAAIAAEGQRLAVGSAQSQHSRMKSLTRLAGRSKGKQLLGRFPVRGHANMAAAVRE